MTTGWLISRFFPYYCARMFTTDPKLIQIAIKAIHIILMMYPIVGFQMVTTNFFQCIGKVKVSIFLSLSRQLLFLLPLLYTLPRFFGVNGVWYSLPSSDFTAALVAFIIMVIFMKKIKKQHIQITNHGE
jgi:Na+-driven multidrug efflux pump